MADGGRGVRWSRKRVFGAGVPQSGAAPGDQSGHSWCHKVWLKSTKLASVNHNNEFEKVPISSLAQLPWMKVHLPMRGLRHSKEDEISCIERQRILNSNISSLTRHFPDPTGTGLGAHWCDRQFSGTINCPKIWNFPKVKIDQTVSSA